MNIAAVPKKGSGAMRRDLTVHPDDWNDSVSVANKAEGNLRVAPQN